MLEKFLACSESKKLSGLLSWVLKFCARALKPLAKSYRTFSSGQSSPASTSYSEFAIGLPAAA